MQHTGEIALEVATRLLPHLQVTQMAEGKQQGSLREKVFTALHVS